MDELGLFWRMQANASYVLKDNVCKFGKQSKERMTIFLAANMTGCDKLTLAIIGKSEKPRQIHTVKNLDFHYYFNQAAWMTGHIFFDLFQKINVEMIKRKRSILMFIDNCKAHPTNFQFSNVTVIFLPANTTSVLQPMDAGVIKCFKGYYRTRMAKLLIKWVAENQFGALKSNAVQFYQAIQMAVASWEDVQVSTVSNCFRHCGFYKAKCLVEAIDAEYDEYKDIEAKFNSIIPKDEAICFDDYVNIDNHLSVSEPLNENPTTDDNTEINTAPANVDINGDLDEENTSDGAEVRIINLQMTVAHLEELKLYALQRSNKEFSNKMLKLIIELENLVFIEPKNYVQTQLNFYSN